MKVYRLITESTLEERILSRSRQKLVLDELVIKKKGETSALTHQFMEEEEANIHRRNQKRGSDQEDVCGTLTFQELWKYLNIGYQAKFVPKNAKERRVLSDEELDAIIDNGKLEKDEDVESDVESDSEDEESGMKKMDDEGVSSQIIEILSSDEENQCEPLSKTAIDHTNKENCDLDVGSKRIRSEPKRYSPKSMKRTQQNRPKLKHEYECFSCRDGGSLIECTICPKVYHATVECAYVKSVPKGTWRCPWHNCYECARSSSHCGGMLFHCMTCPVTYCFDCKPDIPLDRMKQSQVETTKRKLEKLGCPSLGSKHFFKCNSCAEYEKLISRERKEANKLLQQALPIDDNEVVVIE